MVAYILATKTHNCSSSQGGGDDDGGDEDERLFLDIDMSVLGQPREGALACRAVGWWVVGFRPQRKRGDRPPPIVPTNTHRPTSLTPCLSFPPHSRLQPTSATRARSGGSTRTCPGPRT